MEPRKWNTFAADREIFRLRGFTVYHKMYKYMSGVVSIWKHILNIRNIRPSLSQSRITFYNLHPDTQYTQTVRWRGLELTFIFYFHHFRGKGGRNRRRRSRRSNRQSGKGIFRNYQTRTRIQIGTTSIKAGWRKGTWIKY